MKRIRIWLLTIIILVLTMPMASPSFAAVKDYATLQWDITLDSTEYPFEEGTIRITLTSGRAYADARGEVSTGDDKSKPATATKSKIYVDGNETPFTAYNIGGNNYFKLRDVAKVLNIGVGYDDATKVITIDTALDYEN